MCRTPGKAGFAAGGVYFGASPLRCGSPPRSTLWGRLEAWPTLTAPQESSPRGTLSRGICAEISHATKTCSSQTRQSLFEEIFLLKKQTNSFILQLSVPLVFGSPLTSGMPPGNAPGLALLQGLPKPRLRPVKCRVVYHKEIQLHQQR